MDQLLMARLLLFYMGGQSESGTRRFENMRVIAGKYRGRTLRSLRGSATRPTSDRLRETLFNVLTAGNPEAIENTVWLDLFAGTGAVGIEALSRGAKQVYFVETSAAAAKVIEQNLQSLGIADGYKILRDDLAGVVWKLQREHFVGDVVFLDPPYGMRNSYEETLTVLANSSLVWAMSLVVAEHDKKYDPGNTFGSLRRIRTLMQGNNALSFYKIGGQVDLNK
jgi:16S rRNA (guanine966-N2)-methyltransferase